MQCGILQRVILMLLVEKMVQVVKDLLGVLLSSIVILIFTIELNRR